MVTSDRAQGTTIGARLEAYRQRALLTQEQLAHRSGVSVRTIRHLETGRVDRPRSQTLRLLADALELTGPELAALITPQPAAQPAAPPGPGRQLPMDVAGFVGRAGSLAQLDRLLADDGGAPATVVISAISGAAGVGKTALAVHWAHRVRHRFPDGQLYVNLQGYAAGPPLPPLQALARLLHALGVEPNRVPLDVEAAAGLYRSLLTDRRVLIVLDNARDAEQVRPLLPGGPGCAVVVTSRDRLGGLVASHGAHRLGLGVLDPDEAVALLASMLGDRVRAEPEATAALAEACGSLPLALRIAAANLLDQPESSIAGYLAELDAGDRLARLGIAGDEQGAVRVAFDHSYAALPAAAQRLFRLLALVPGPQLTVAAAAALTGMPVAAAAAALERLVGAHLVEPHAPGRFALHDLLRRYARQRADQDESTPEREAATERLLGWYLHTADTADRLLYPEKLRLPVPAPVEGLPRARFGDHAEALAWLDAERPSLVAAVRHAADHGPRPLAWLLADAVRAFFWRRRHMVDWLAVAQAALSAAEAEDDPQAKAAAHRNLGLVRQCLGDYDQAASSYDTAAAFAREAGWVEGEAAAHNTLALVHTDLGRLEQAAGHHARALTLNREIGSRAGQAIALANLGDLHRELGALAEAEDHLTQALALYREVGSSAGQATALDTLGETCRDLGRLDDALAHLTEALTLARELGSRHDEAYDLHALATVHQIAGRCDLAMELTLTAASLSRDLGEPRLEASVLNTLGCLHLSLGDPGRALEHHQRALDLAGSTRARYPETEALLGLAAVHQRTGRHTQAMEDARRALAIAREVGYRVLEASALTGLADACAALGHRDQAAGHARRALAIDRGTGHRLGQARAQVALGHALRSGDPDAAVACWREARALLTGIGARDEAGRVAGLARDAGL